MCTLTVVPQGGGRYRLAFNRDEARTRPAGLPPQHRRFGDRHAILPIDPTSGGTWLAVNDAGLAFALTNRNPPAPAPPAAHSRGLVIPALLGCGSLETVRRGVEELTARRYAPFRLVVLAEPCLLAVTWDGADWKRELVPAPRVPVLFTSSGLGDHLVEGPRAALFEELVRWAPDPEAAQDEFHRHTWPDRPHLSVNMARADARTVSHTLVELSPDEAVMTYYPDAPTADFQTVEVAMARLIFPRS